MQILNVLYYNYFLFYKKIIKDPEPHLATVLSLSFSQSLFINAAIETISLKWFCYRFEIWVQLAVLGLVIYANYHVYHRKGKAKQVIEGKPTLANSKSLSIAITWLFFLIAASWLFWGPIYGKHLLSQCR